MVRIQKTFGFTLLEVLITVALIGILVSIAYPSYTEFVVKSNRSEAQRELVRLANLQEQAFVDNRAYTEDMTQLGANADPFITDGGNYSIDANVGNNGTTFTLTATALLLQKKRDTKCAKFSVTETGEKDATNSDCWEK
ncbi:type IV pilin protein [Litorilituus lipolyticus]|uniref:Prepilin-type N-terminal cleavage/methylation domain-containing protein n=1 Tax=Litorilituus lipolyticus TaxID=2491017 RepID=A0A502L5T2_9GAMM|nr:type IV pilin protein [Litorilituus lipolyticus]TPH19232.1 prepilin-type N-terminal cleavage/methylation domain-containing protein [Litorilituus lipolyticus]